MKHLFLILMLLLITACSPRYEIKTHYTPPTDFSGKQCVQTCTNDKRTCQSRCDQKEDQCLAIAEQSARDAFPSLMLDYQDLQDQYLYSLDGYNREMNAWERKKERLKDNYEHYRHKCKKDDSKSYECRKSKEANDELRHMHRSEPDEPVKPEQPTLDTEIKNAQKSCHHNCGCASEYDNCFSSCGGKLTHEKICVENCD